MREWPSSQGFMTLQDCIVQHGPQVLKIQELSKPESASSRFTPTSQSPRVLRTIIQLQRFFRPLEPNPPSFVHRESEGLEP